MSEVFQMSENKPDQDSAKGATENDHDASGNTGLQDTDFPEPGQSPEHSGEPERKTA
jgi:hypothetical protein